MTNKEDFKLPDFLFWVILAVAFPAFSGNLSLINIAQVLIYLCAVHFVGEKILTKIQIINEIPSILKIGIFIVVGGILSSILFMLFSFATFIYLLFIGFIYDIYRNKRVTFKFSFYHFVCLVPFLIVLFQTNELAYAIKERINHADGDYFYYTALVESFKTNQSISSAIFHEGLPINYPSLPFMAPALLAKFAGIPSQFALWGIYMKLLPVACLGVISYVIVQLYEVLFEVRNSELKSFPLKLLLAGLFFMFLGPLHFINLFKLDFKNTLFLGSGYLLPTGSPGFSLAMLLSSIILLMVITARNFSFYYSIIIVTLFCFVLVSKIALFLPLLILVGLLSLWQLFHSEKKLFFLLIGGLPVFIAVYVFILGSADSVMAVHFTSTGYFQNYFSDLARKYHIPGHGLLQLLLMTFLIIFMWISIKLLILALAFKDVFKRHTKAITIMVAAVLSFLICLLPGFFIESVGKDNAGKVLFDGSFDMEQFARGGVFLLTIISLVFALYLLFNYSKIWVRRSVGIIFIFWCGIIAFSFFSSSFISAGKTQEEWYVEVKKDYVRIQPHLMAMMGNGEYSGQAVTDLGVHPWYCTGIREDKEGYVFTKTAYDRNYAFRAIFDSSKTIKERRLTADSLKRVGIDCIVASPATMQKIMVAIKDSIISPIAGTKWFYHFH